MCRQQYKFYLWDKPLNPDETRLSEELTEATQDMTKAIAELYGLPPDLAGGGEFTW